MTYIATGGRQGVLNATDLAVLPLSTPGAGVRVQPGACVIVNRALNTSNDSYVARLPSEDTVSTTANGAAGTRADLVVARVENPFISGEPWATPVDVTVGPYIFTRILQNVPAGTKSVDQLALGYSAIPLARIDWPINTSTVTSGMITDLRAVVNPAPVTPYPAPGSDGGDNVRNYVYVRRQSSGPYNGGDQLPASQAVYKDWPVAATWPVAFPAWATHIEWDLRVNGAQVINGDVTGEIQLMIGGVAAGSMVFDFNQTGATNPYRGIIPLGGEYQISPAWRGTIQTCKLQARMTLPDARVIGAINANTMTYTSGFMFHHARPALS